MEQGFAKYCLKLTELKLITNNITNEELVVISENCVLLEKLSFENRDGVNTNLDMGLNSIIKHCIYMRDLSFTNCVISDDVMAYVFEQAPRLRGFTASTAGLTDKAFERLSQCKGLQLQRVNFTRNHITVKAIYNLLNSCVSLSTIVFEYCDTTLLEWQQLHKDYETRENLLLFCGYSYDNI